MRRLSIYFLAFLTIWMSTWLVTDIHDFAITDKDHPHPLFSVEHSVEDNQLASQDHNSHCGVCSYDHNGHMGQTLTSPVFLTKSFVEKNTVNTPLPIDFWYSKTTPPKLRPPIV